MRTMIAGVCLTMAFVSGSALAQTDKGNKLIGTSLGGASYGSATATTSSADSFSFGGIRTETSHYSIFLSPSVGWFVKDNLAVGGTVRVAFSQAKTDYDDPSFTPVTGTQTSTRTAPSVFVEPFVRYYFQGSESAKPFVEANVSFAFDPVQVKSSTATGGYSSEARTTPKGSYGAGLIIGYEHFINTTVGIAFSSGVSYFHRKDELEFTGDSGLGPYTRTMIVTSDEWGIPLAVGLVLHLQ